MHEKAIGCTYPGQGYGYKPICYKTGVTANTLAGECGNLAKLVQHATTSGNTIIACTTQKKSHKTKGPADQGPADQDARVCGEKSCSNLCWPPADPGGVAEDGDVMGCQHSLAPICEHIPSTPCDTMPLFFTPSLTVPADTNTPRKCHNCCGSSCKDMHCVAELVRASKPQLHKKAK